MMDYYMEANKIKSELFQNQFKFDKMSIITPEGELIGDPKSKQAIWLVQHLPLRQFRILSIHEFCNLLYPITDPTKELKISIEHYEWYTKRKFHVDSAALTVLANAETFGLQPEMYFEFLELVCRMELDDVENQCLTAAILQSLNCRSKFARSFLRPGLPPCPDSFYFSDLKTIR